MTLGPAAEADGEEAEEFPKHLGLHNPVALRRNGRFQTIGKNFLAQSHR